ncbi:P-loop ATPase, Sll1717 family [Amycolatopsis sp. VC5-11]|uniref:P-loop ATPase, Sll1717 family n=1 Tax=Amycolatopsis sp. VC5-11 TaxID=3120156 RepID=UPI0030096EA5
MTKSFDRLYFGKSAAENEAEIDPVKFYNSFTDLWNLPARILSGEVFLLTGPKGAGKSAVAKYLELDTKKKFGESGSFVRLTNLDELQKSSFTTDEKKNTSSEIGVGSYHLSDSAWKLFICIRIIESLFSDQSCRLSDVGKLRELFKAMQKVGLTEDDFPQILRKVRKRSTSFHVPKIADTTIESAETESLNIQQLGDALLRHIEAALTDNVHILVIDGLDRAIVASNAYWESISSLVRTCESIHLRLRASRSTIRIALLCRSDLFGRVRFPDAPKIREDWGQSIEWHYGTDEAEDSFLWDVVDNKAKIGLPAKMDVVASYFPVTVPKGKSGAPIAIHEHLLRMTRQTPRDILQLMREIARMSPQSVELSGRQVRAGVNNYCRTYFVEEIRAEMRGLLSDEVPDRIESLLQRIGTRVFNREQFMRSFDQCGLAEFADGDRVLEYLFLAGAIGNLVPTQNEDRIQFYHRRNTSQLNARGPLIMHGALVYGLNLSWSG